MSVSMSGFLDKAGEKGLGAKRCQTRWFEVSGTNMPYSRAKGETPIGTIDLSIGTSTPRAAIWPERLLGTLSYFSFSAFSDLISSIWPGLRNLQQRTFCLLREFKERTRMDSKYVGNRGKKEVLEVVCEFLSIPRAPSALKNLIPNFFAADSYPRSHLVPICRDASRTRDVDQSPSRRINNSSLLLCTSASRCSFVRIATTPARAAIYLECSAFVGL